MPTEAAHDLLPPPPPPAAALVELLVLLLLLLLPQPAMTSAPAAIAATMMRPFTTDLLLGDLVFMPPPRAAFPRTPGFRPGNTRLPANRLGGRPLPRASHP